MGVATVDEVVEPKKVGVAKLDEKVEPEEFTEAVEDFGMTPFVVMSMMFGLTICIMDLNL